MKKAEINDNLAALVKSRFAIAESANLGAYERAKRCTKLMEGDTLYTDVEPDELLAEMSMNITLPLVVGYLAMLEEILDPIIAHPFTLSPSPIVELPPDVEEEITQVLEENLPALLAMAGGDQSSVPKLRAALRETTKRVRDERAEKAAERLTDVVRDRLKDAGFSDALSEFLYDYLVYPTAIFKGVYFEMEPRKHWGTYGMEYTDELTAKVGLVTPFNILPAPHARDLQSCPYVIERMRMHSNDILNLIQSSAFDADAISDVFDTYDSFIIPYACDGGLGGRQPDEEDSSYSSPEDLGYYDILVHYGQVQGKYLEEYGVQVDDIRRLYEAEIWLIGDIVIRASLKTPGRQKRPFFTASHSKTPGKFWGKSAVEIIKDAQIQCTEAARSLARNMRYASGPMGEVDADRVMGEMNPEIMQPLMMRSVKGSSGLPAYRFLKVPSLAEELLGIYRAFSQEAYNLIGLPPIAYGNMNGAATLARTSGGVAMVLNQASKPVKRSMRILEAFTIKPVIQAFVDLELMDNNDPDLRGDVEVTVYGVQTIADKETKAGKLEWIMQSVVSAVGAGLVDKDVFLRLLRKVFEDSGIDTAGLPSFDFQDALNQDIDALRGGIPVGANPPVEGGASPTGSLDGRSQVAIDQIEGA